jgi:hypothetical protein
MLNKYVFYTEDEIKEIAEKIKKKKKNKTDFIKKRANQGMILYDILEEYAQKEIEEAVNDDKSVSMDDGYFTKI